MSFPCILVSVHDKKLNELATGKNGKIRENPSTTTKVLLLSVKIYSYLWQNNALIFLFQMSQTVIENIQITS